MTTALTATAFFPADLQAFQRIAYAALTASEPLRTFMLTCVGMVFRITDETVRTYLCRGLAPGAAGCKPLCPAACAGFVDAETQCRFFEAQSVLVFIFRKFRRKSVEHAMHSAESFYAASAIDNYNNLCDCVEEVFKTI